MAAARSPVLILSEGRPSDPTLRLPSKSDNIFERVIRNPRAESAHARERECTEMLASVLINAPSLRHHLLRWMARHSNVDPTVLDGLDMAVETELRIGTKRDDMRIEGWHARADGQRRRAICWTVEVKVGATFHDSLAQGIGQGDDGYEDTTDDRSDPVLVNQLLNYNRWLCAQDADHCRGFVLALRDMTGVLPPSLRAKWACLSWTQLGLEVEFCLKGGTLPGDERFLAKHLLGFVRAHLWRPSEMPEQRLEFDDVALIRAFKALGAECEKKVNRLVGGLRVVVERSKVGTGPVTEHQRLYGQWVRSEMVRNMSRDSRGPMLRVGVVVDDVTVQVQTSPKHARKAAIRDALKSVEKRLAECNRMWYIEEEVDAWVDVWLSLPLTDLLSAEDQDKVIAEFVRAALADLKASGAADLVAAAAGERVRRRSTK